MVFTAKVTGIIFNKLSLSEYAGALELKFIAFC